MAVCHLGKPLESSVLKLWWMARPFVQTLNPTFDRADKQNDTKLSLTNGLKVTAWKWQQIIHLETTYLSGPHTLHMTCSWPSRGWSHCYSPSIETNSTKTPTCKSQPFVSKRWSTYDQSTPSLHFHATINVITRYLHYLSPSKLGAIFSLAIAMHGTLVGAIHHMGSHEIWCHTSHATLLLVKMHT